MQAGERGRALPCGRDRGSRLEQGAFLRKRKGSPSQSGLCSVLDAKEYSREQERTATDPDLDRKATLRVGLTEIGKEIGKDFSI